jgi:hypothetical protein
MRTTQVPDAPISAALISAAPTPDALTPDALIKEARRRQRRRYLLAGGAVLGATAVIALVLAGLGQDGSPRAAGPAEPGQSTPGLHKPAPPARQVRRAPGQIPASTGTTVLMWPAGFPAFTATSGPPAYLDNLAAGTLTQSQRPQISAGDFEPLLLQVGGYLVYVGNGTTAIRADLAGRPRVLAGTPYFAPSATPGHIWLKYLAATGDTVRLAAVTGGPPGPPVALPRNTTLIAGTGGGLLLQDGSGRMELWQPGGQPRPLPFRANWGFGFAAGARLVAYGTGCTEHGVSATAIADANAGYPACRMLRVYDVITGRVRSFTRPAGTAGWVPHDFTAGSAFSAGNRMMAAYAVTRPLGYGRVRLYLLRLAGHARPVSAVPSSGAHLFSRTAWSVRGSWLLYQSHGRLWAYQPGTGKTRWSRTPCCQYTVMVSVPSAGPAGPG